MSRSRIERKRDHDMKKLCSQMTLSRVQDRIDTVRAHAHGVFKQASSRLDGRLELGKTRREPFCYEQARPRQTSKFAEIR